MTDAVRTIIQNPPFVEFDRDNEWHEHGLWPARWVHPMQPHPSPVVVAYRKTFHLDRDTTVRVHVTADERYALYMDGELVGRGSEYGDETNWYFETYDLSLPAGSHTIVAQVWSLGELAPYAQMSVRHGFLLAAEGEALQSLSTGLAPWEAKIVEGIEFVDPKPAFGTGANLVIDGRRYPWGFEGGAGSGWEPVAVGVPGTNHRFRNNISPSHLMRPAVLPPMIDQPIEGGRVRFVGELDRLDRLPSQAVRSADELVNERPEWEALASGGAVVVPPHTRRRVLLDLRDYYCAYPEVTTGGGAGSVIALQWAESLFSEPAGATKGNRDEVEGKYFRGVGDVFRPDGGAARAFRTLWWQAGRYVQLCVETADEPLRIEGIRLRETRYPLQMESSLRCGDERWSSATRIAFRALQMCSHETYIDCPYYEQLQYSGDSRLKALTTLVCTRDDRLVRKAIDTFYESRLPSGLTQARYPSRVRQTIAPFSQFWIGMVHDHALWRGDMEYIRGRMPGVRGVLDALLQDRGGDGLLRNPGGWNFIDWVPTWVDGVRPDSEEGPNGIINLQFVYTLQMAAQLEEWIGERELAVRWRRLASESMANAIGVFWSEEHGLFADDASRSCYSEHAQCFAVLSDLLDEDRVARVRDALIHASDICRTTISYTHYLFETYRRLGLMDPLFERAELWLGLESQGFKTTPEQPEPTRSDCHGWASHLIYHLLATVLGIRPLSPGFSTVRITPCLRPSTRLGGTLVHPSGTIAIQLERVADRLSGVVTLPATANGVLEYGGAAVQLNGGVETRIDLPTAPSGNGHPTDFALAGAGRMSGRPSAGSLDQLHRRIAEKIRDRAAPPVRIVALGDSVTQGVAEIDHLLHDQTYHAQLSRQLEQRYPLCTFSVLNAGVDGHNAAQGLARFDRDVAGAQPDLLLIAFGLNDALQGREGLSAFASCLTTLIRRGKDEAGADVILLTPNMMLTRSNDRVPERYREYEETMLRLQTTGILAAYADRVREVAAQCGVVVADVYEAWHAMHCRGVDTTAMLANGLNHPDVQGHALAASVLFDRIVACEPATADRTQLSGVSL